MKLSDFVRVFYLDDDGNDTGDSFITKSSYYGEDEYEQATRTAPLTNPSVDDVVQILEDEAENWNYHSLVDIYASIAYLVEKYADQETAKKVMIDIMEEHGGFIG
jgi:hypothetical protein